ncbi:four helix bundle protein [Dyadobacter sp. CY343]|uniref:four helix bundle protein n=1 Tax=Dyadobacter sp. CY343 TaxID=2907299 RepID=UPI001F25B0E5|nr:four helix bundle protein [Dyadobacter sp. CY343]MCE7059052.1 four helix bundle protein [Dyadobacter sp. CY343]
MEKVNTKEDFASLMRQRTKQFVLRSIKLFEALPHNEQARIIGRQFLRSSSSVGANYRAVCRSRSQKEFYAKISVTIEEADETLFWLEIISESGLLPIEKLKALIQEAEEIVKILSKARKSLN